MRRLLFFVLFALAAVAAHAADLNGTWNGSYSVTVQCPSGGTISSQGGASATLSQSGSSVSGNMTLTNFNAPDTQHCSGSPLGTVTFPVSGSYDWSTLTLQMNVTQNVVVNLQGTANDTTIDLHVVASDSSGEFVLAKGSSGPPTDISGTWSGTYQWVSFCNGNPQTSNGSMTIAIAQSSGAISGTVSYVVSLINCAPATPETVTAAFTGIVVAKEFSITFTDPHLGTVAGGGIVADGVMTVAFSNNDTSVLGTLTRTGAGPAPSIGSFTANPATINGGQSSTLTWTTSNAASVTIDHGVGSQPSSGSIVIAPPATTTYVLTATNNSGSAMASATVTVNTSAPPPNVVVTQFPTGILQAVGQSGATDHYTLQNSGSTDTDVTLAQNGNFFTQSPVSFHLAAGASRIITVTANAQPAGTYEGTAISGNLTIPIRLLVAAPPAGTVSPQLVGSTRLETVATIGQNQGSGSATFTNNGTATLVGLAVSDVPWMTPQSGVITIPPGRTVAISYAIDRTKRLDGGAVGGAKCTLSLRFLTGSGAGKWASPLDTPSSSTVSVPLVDVVKPGVAPGTPPPLLSGEVAFFVPGISSKSTANGDLLLANRGTASISDLKMFFGGSGAAATQVSALGAIAANAGITFPSVVKNVFGAASLTGSLQLRSSQLTNVSIATVQVNTTSAASSYATALPILRSDRGAHAGDAIFLAGVAKNGTRSTNLELQEMSGNAVTVATDFLDANGNVLSSRSDNLGGFAFVEVSDAVPTGAVTARVRVAAGTSAVVGAYAIVVDSLTNDSFTVTDLLTSANASTLVAPLFPPASGSPVQSIGFTNVTTSPLTVTATAVTTAGHHRAAPHAFSVATNAAASTTFTLPPGGFASFVPSGSGYVKLDAAAGALRASATYAAPVNGSGNAIGSGMPVLANVLALANGAAKRFAGVDDASPATVLRATPATYRTNLMLIETAGQNATARVTLRFSFIASSLTSATATVSKDFDLSANGSIVINDLARSVLGIERDTLGDLRNMQVDVSVVAGSGRVVPLLESIDNATNDVTVRND